MIRAGRLRADVAASRLAAYGVPDEVLDEIFAVPTTHAAGALKPGSLRRR